MWFVTRRCPAAVELGYGGRAAVSTDSHLLHSLRRRVGAQSGAGSMEGH
jgi:hypothetical protein